MVNNQVHETERFKEICGKCESEIKDKECSCGIWLHKDDEEAEVFKIYKNALEAYKKHVENSVLPPVFSMDCDNIQALFFVGTDEELDLIKKSLRALREIMGERKK